MERSLERRQFGRVHLLAHGSGKTCTITVQGVGRKADLIDISAGGARLKLPPPPLDPGAARLVFSACEIEDGGLLQNLSATVQWRNGFEVGLQFRPELNASLRVLQNLVS
jgi:hypothetical protein